MIHIQAKHAYMTFGIILLCITNAVYVRNPVIYTNPLEPLENYFSPQTTNALVLEQATWYECLTDCMRKQCRSKAYVFFFFLS